jgi:hypothetical protein
MKGTLRSIALPAALAAAGLFASARPAAAHGWGRVGFQFHSPHAAVAFGVGHPFFPHHVFYRAHFGYGYWGPAHFCGFHGIRHAHWVPVPYYGSGRYAFSPRLHGRFHHRAFHRRY